MFVRAGCKVEKDKKFLKMNGCRSKHKVNIGKCVGLCASRNAGSQCHTQEMKLLVLFRCKSRATGQKIFSYMPVMITRKCTCLRNN